MDQRRKVNQAKSGLLAAIVAFTLWGVLPMYWKLIDFANPATIVAHRTLWSLAILGTILLLRREWRSWIELFRSRSAILWLLLSGTLLAANWILYVWATLNERILEGALGYYLNPFFNMLFGALWFGERHNRLQLTAIGIALAGVALQIPAVEHFPWVAITLAITFSLYAVVKKRANPGSRHGLTAESALLAPIALLWLLTQESSVSGAFGGSLPHALLLIGAGIATTLPLLCFGHAARHIRLSSLGMIQFIGPSLQFLIGWKWFGEPMTPIRLGSFALIWLAIAIYSYSLSSRKRP